MNEQNATPAGAQDPGQGAHEGVATDAPMQADAADVHDPAAATEAAPVMSEPVVTEEQVDVSIQRSVRFGRLLIVGAIIGGVLAVILTLLRPVDPEALYEMRQIAGFMLVLGAAIGLFAGALLGLILNLFARRKRGSGVAVHTDVQ